MEVSSIANKSLRKDSQGSSRTTLLEFKDKPRAGEVDPCSEEEEKSGKNKAMPIELSWHRGHTHIG